MCHLFSEPEAEELSSDGENNENKASKRKAAEDPDAPEDELPKKKKKKKKKMVSALLFILHYSSFIIIHQSIITGQEILHSTIAAKAGDSIVFVTVEHSKLFN